MCPICYEWVKVNTMITFECDDMFCRGCLTDSYEFFYNDKRPMSDFKCLND